MTINQRVYVADHNVAAEATLSIPGGGVATVAGRGLELMQTLPLSDATRFDDDTAAVIADLGRVQRITSWGIYGHNFRRSAERKVITSQESDFDPLKFSEDWTDIYDPIHPSRVLDWEDANWWDGKPLERDLQLWTRQWRFPLMAGTDCRYLRFDVRDVGNPEGALDWGYLGIWRGMQPGFTIDLGAALGFVEADQIDRTSSGFVAVDDRPAPRTLAIRFSNLTQAEAMRFFDMGRRNGVKEPLMVIFDPTDVTDSFRTDFLARLIRRTKPVKLNQVHWQIDIEVEEILG